MILVGILLITGCISEFTDIAEPQNSSPPLKINQSNEAPSKTTMPKRITTTSILKTKRIQDGIDRIEFTVGPVALKQLKEKESLLKETAKLLKVKEEKVPETVRELFENWKEKRKELRKLKKK